MPFEREKKLERQFQHSPPHIVKPYAGIKLVYAVLLLVSFGLPILQELALGIFRILALGLVSFLGVLPPKNCFGFRL